MLSLSVCPYKTFPDGSQAKGGKYFMLILDRTAQWNYDDCIFEIKKNSAKTPEFRVLRLYYAFIAGWDCNHLPGLQWAR